MAENGKLSENDVEGAKRLQILETEDERRTRLLSLKIIYFTMFLMTLGFSIILTGIWPYLDKVQLSNNNLIDWFLIECFQLDTSAGKTFMGLIVAGNVNLR